MAQDLFRTIRQVRTMEELDTLERNIRAKEALSPEIKAAIEAKYAEFGRAFVASKTGLAVDDLSPAEQRIVDAVGRYVGLQKREGKGAARTIRLLSNRGFIEAAEVTVAKSKVTQGFTVLNEADMRALSFEQIIVDHTEEFSARAIWFARRTLGLPNDNEKPPAEIGTTTQRRTERIFDWLSARASRHNGLLNGYTNAEIGALLGFDDLTRYGRVLGNIQSRIDFGCYQANVPPLGLCVVEHFANAWAQEGRSWTFPVQAMRSAAQSFVWSSAILDEVRRNVRLLPGQAAVPWRKEVLEREQAVRRWAEGLQTSPAQPPTVPKEDDLSEIERKLLGRAPKVRERVSRLIERGTVGSRLKRLNGFKCQICEALGTDPIGFRKADGDPYVEAHHALPVSVLEVGSLSATNIMILCANHHRQMHYGIVSIERAADHFILTLDERRITIQRFGQVGSVRTE